MPARRRRQSPSTPGQTSVTVLAAAETVTIQRACDIAADAGREVMADLIAVAHPARRAVEIASAGVTYLCCHTAFDMQLSGADPARELSEVRAALPGARIAAAGGITPQRIGLLKPGTEIIIVGGYVTRATDPRAAIQEVSAAMS